jgi:hypothetical protein
MLCLLGLIMMQAGPLGAVGGQEEHPRRSALRPCLDQLPLAGQRRNREPVADRLAPAERSGVTRTRTGTQRDQRIPAVISSKTWRFRIILWISLSCPAWRSSGRRSRI